MRNYKLYIFKSVKLDLPYGYRSKMAREIGIPRETKPYNENKSARKHLPRLYLLSWIVV